MSKPITPGEISTFKKVSIPDEVFEAFNELIVKEWNGHDACFRLQNVAELALQKLNQRSGTDKLKIIDLYDNHWLDVEAIYREAGWIVGYDQPGYNENYHATFTFRPKVVPS